MPTEITSIDELRTLVGEPTPMVRDKVRETLSPDQTAWIARSPFCLVATSDADGRCDVSPKGDPVGMAHVVDEKTVLVPERPGNRRVDGFANVLQNPHVGLLFLVPGRGDTLRVNGTARLLTDVDEPALEVKGHRPTLVLEVTVEETFFHCAKAFLRSKLWEPETWEPDALPPRARIAKREWPDVPLADLEKRYGSAYGDNLYVAG
ncbi:hypothetical protein CLV56_2768 [Mumia flava]|uniref:Pyridoxamine 5'-phosphate oxidase N-terminal domain-containing protein n=1 Tax=Mumia flava TaxID=1348852 RepID=A0A0B2BN00_9ACTN|nr:MSMEG_1061 family FMN-dependent PPOX-type flavoprotein [Mumia flava]PJJ58517.1 hypothetical protein CLV56_2768 [Mumia flava]